MERVNYIPPMIGTCENCKKKDVCLYTDWATRIVAATERFSYVDSPFKISIECRFFDVDLKSKDDVKL